VVAWARRTAHLTLEDAARRLKRPIEEISGWEDGTVEPTLPQAREAARVYHRPLAVFFLPDPPTTFSVPKFNDFRRLPSGYPKDFSYELQTLLRRAHMQQEWAREFFEEQDEPPLDFVGTATLDADPIALASTIRQRLGFNPTMRQEWASRDAALRGWIDLAESVGVFVFQSGPVEPIEARGFVLTDPQAPFVYLNSKDSRAARVFTLAHELVHVWLGAPGISNLNIPQKARSDMQRIEVYCDAVAAEILAPIDLDNDAWNHLDQTLPLRDRIDEVSICFRVSSEVVARRLLDLKIIRQSIYEELREQYRREWVGRRDRLREKDRGPSYPRRVIAENGRSFTRMVVSAYRTGETSPRELSALLNVKLNNLPRVMSELSAQKGSVRTRRRPA